MLDATGYMQAYAQAENSMKITMDSAILVIRIREKTKVLLNWIDK